MVKIMENPIKMDDLGVPLFLETPICSQNSQAFEGSGYLGWCFFPGSLNLFPLDTAVSPVAGKITTTSKLFGNSGPTLSSSSKNYPGTLHVDH